jgi:hypothetical protein
VLFQTLPSGHRGSDLEISKAPILKIPALSRRPAPGYELVTCRKGRSLLFDNHANQHNSMATAKMKPAFSVTLSRGTDLEDSC